MLFGLPPGSISPAKRELCHKGSVSAIVQPKQEDATEKEKEKEEDRIHSMESAFCCFLLYGSQAISDSHVANAGANRNTTRKR